MDIFEYDMTDVEDRYLNNREHKKECEVLIRQGLVLNLKKNYFVLLTLQLWKKVWYDDMKLITITTWNNKLYKEYVIDLSQHIIGHEKYTVYNEDDGMYDAMQDLKAFVDRNKHGQQMIFYKTQLDLVIKCMVIVVTTI